LSQQQFLRHPEARRATVSKSDNRARQPFISTSLAQTTAVWHTYRDMRENLHERLKSVETLYIDVIFRQRPGRRASLLRGMLHLCSKLYLLIGVKFRRFL
jgi:hypothetical protein